MRYSDSRVIAESFYMYLQLKVRNGVRPGNSDLDTYIGGVRKVLNYFEAREVVDIISWLCDYKYSLSNETLEEMLEYIRPSLNNFSGGELINLIFRLNDNDYYYSEEILADILENVRPGMDNISGKQLMELIMVVDSDLYIPDSNLLGRLITAAFNDLGSLDYIDLTRILIRANDCEVELEANCLMDWENQIYGYLPYLNSDDILTLLNIAVNSYQHIATNNNLVERSLIILNERVGSFQLGQLTRVLELINDYVRHYSSIAEFEGGIDNITPALSILEKLGFNAEMQLTRIWDENIEDAAHLRCHLQELIESGESNIRDILGESRVSLVPNDLIQTLTAIQENNLRDEALIGLERNIYHNLPHLSTNGILDILTIAAYNVPHMAYNGNLVERSIIILNERIPSLQINEIIETLELVEVYNQYYKFPREFLDGVVNKLESAATKFHGGLKEEDVNSVLSVLAKLGYSEESYAFHIWNEALESAREQHCHLQESMENGYADIRDVIGESRGLGRDLTTDEILQALGTNRKQANYKNFKYKAPMVSCKEEFNNRSQFKRDDHDDDSNGPNTKGLQSSIINLLYRKYHNNDESQEKDYNTEGNQNYKQQSIYHAESNSTYTEELSPDGIEAYELNSLLVDMPLGSW